MSRFRGVLLEARLVDPRLQQVRGQRWHGRSTRWEQPGEAGLRERAEAEVLRLYLHCPRYRGAIRAELRRRDLERLQEAYGQLAQIQGGDLDQAMADGAAMGTAVLQGVDG